MQEDDFMFFHAKKVEGETVEQRATQMKAKKIGQKHAP